MQVCTGMIKKMVDGMQCRIAAKIMYSIQWRCIDETIRNWVNRICERTG